MKNYFTHGALCVAFITLGQPTAVAQAPGSLSPSEQVGKPGGKKQRVPRLNREEAQRLRAAKKIAAKDPTVRSLKEARKAIDEQLELATSAAMLSADPGLGPVLEKVKESRQRAKGMRDRWDSLSPEQRESLKEARQAAEKDPEVVAMRQKLQSAESPEAKRQAAEEMRAAMKAATLRQNPELVPLLEKLGPPPGRRGPAGPPPSRGAPAGPSQEMN